MVVHRKLYIAVGGAKKKIVMVGESIALHTSVIEIKGYDLVLWKFEDHVMAEINKETNLFLLTDTSDERFNSRLDLDRDTGDLIIRSIQTTDSGVYHLHMNSSSHTIQRNINVTVSDQHTPDPGPHTIGALIGGIVLGILVAFLLGIVYYFMKKRRDQHTPDPGPHTIGALIGGIVLGILVAFLLGIVYYFMKKRRAETPSNNGHHTTVSIDKDDANISDKKQDDAKERMITPQK